MLTKTFVVSAARKLCLSWTGTVSKPGVTQMTSWPGWAPGTDLGDLGAGRLIRLWPCCAPAGYTNNRRLHGKTLDPDPCPPPYGDKASWHHILRTWYFDASSNNTQPVCLGVPDDIGTNELLVALFVPSAVEHFHRFPALLQLWSYHCNKTCENSWVRPLLIDDVLVLRCLDLSAYLPDS